MFINQSGFENVLMITWCFGHGNVKCAQASQNIVLFNDSETRNDGNHGFCKKTKSTNYIYLHWKYMGLVKVLYFGE